MSNPEISIIVPVYNSALTLRRCIDSLINQTYRSFEVILVDDGSTDDSLDICKMYQEKDKRIKVLHKDNGGVSSARNYGIDHSNGDYVMFVDSDDSVLPDYIKRLYKSYDFVTSGYYEQQDNGDFRDIIFKEQVISKEFFSNNMSLVMDQGYFGAPWAKMFKSNIIKKNNIRFPETIEVSEDTYFIMTYLNYVQTISIVSQSGYYNYYSCNSLARRKHALLANWLSKTDEATYLLFNLNNESNFLYMRNRCIRRIEYLINYYKKWGYSNKQIAEIIIREDIYREAIHWGIRNAQGKRIWLLLIRLKNIRLANFYQKVMGFMLQIKNKIRVGLRWI